MSWLRRLLGREPKSYSILDDPRIAPRHCPRCDGKTYSDGDSLFCGGEPPCGWVRDLNEQPSPDTGPTNCPQCNGKLSLTATEARCEACSWVGQLCDYGKVWR